MKNYTLPELIAGCKSNQRLMQKALYETYSGRLYAVCMRYLKNEEDSQDVLQNAFVKIFGQIFSYQQVGNFEGWMRKIVIHTAIDYLRKRNVKFEQLSTDPHSEMLTLTAQPLEQMEMKDMINQIQKLPDGYRIVFNMYVIEGFSHKEIAESLGISENTSKSQLSRARVILQKRIKKEEEVENHYGNS